jgi:hypothetical protein
MRKHPKLMKEVEAWIRKHNHSSMRGSGVILVVSPVTEGFPEKAGGNSESVVVAPLSVLTSF